MVWGRTLLRCVWGWVQRRVSVVVGLVEKVPMSCELVTTYNSVRTSKDSALGCAFLYGLTLKVS